MAVLWKYIMIFFCFKCYCNNYNHIKPFHCSSDSISSDISSFFNYKIQIAVLILNFLRSEIPFVTSFCCLNFLYLYYADQHNTYIYIARRNYEKFLFSSLNWLLRLWDPMFLSIILLF